MAKSETTPFDPLDSTSNDSGGDEVPYDRSMVIGELLALEFDDDKPYTRAELDKLNDDQLIDLYDSEMFGAEGADAPPDDDADSGELEEGDADEEVECSVCGVTKVCDFEDEEGEPICADCEESDDSPGDETEEVESETEEDEESESDSESDVDEEEES